MTSGTFSRSSLVLTIRVTGGAIQPGVTADEFHSGMAEFPCLPGVRRMAEAAVHSVSSSRMIRVCRASVIVRMACTAILGSPGIRASCMTFAAGHRFVRSSQRVTGRSVIEPSISPCRDIMTLDAIRRKAGSPVIGISRSRMIVGMA